MDAASGIGTSGSEAVSRQILSFQLGGETYGVDILRVQEIRGWSPVTKLPSSPPHMLGVLNLRGSVVPIMDMRLRFGLDSAEFTPLTVIIVLSLQANGRRRELGLVVDSVSDVVDLAEGALSAAPELNGRASDATVDGLATVGDRLLILLNAEELIGSDLADAALATAH